jgi:hypothetical protein
MLIRIRTRVPRSVLRTVRTYAKRDGAGEKTNMNQGVLDRIRLSQEDPRPSPRTWTKTGRQGLNLALPWSRKA